MGYLHMGNVCIQTINISFTENLIDRLKLTKNNTTATEQGTMEVSATRPPSEFGMCKLIKKPSKLFQ